MAEHERLFVGGRWPAPRADGVIEVVAPHTEGVIATVGTGRELGPEGLARHLELEAISVAANQGGHP